MGKFRVLDHATAYINEVIENIGVISGINMVAYQDFVVELTPKVYDLAELQGEIVAVTMFLNKVISELEKTNKETANLVLKYINIADAKDLKLHLAKVKTISAGIRYRYPNMDFKDDLEPYIKSKFELMELERRNRNMGDKMRPVFDDSTLTTLHELFNDEGIWDKIPLVDFLTTFSGEGCKVTPCDNKKSLFCYLLGEIEELRCKEVCPNFDIWVKDTFRIDDYKGQKRNKAKEGSKAWLERQNISRKIRLNLME